MHYIGEEMRFLNIEDATKNGDYYNATRCVAKIARYQIIRDGSWLRGKRFAGCSTIKYGSSVDENDTALSISWH